MTKTSPISTRTGVAKDSVCSMAITCNVGDMSKPSFFAVSHRWSNAEVATPNSEKLLQSFQASDSYHTHAMKVEQIVELETGAASFGDVKHQPTTKALEILRCVRDRCHKNRRWSNLHCLRRYSNYWQRRIPKHWVLRPCLFAAYVLLNANENILRSMSKKSVDKQEVSSDFPYAPSSVLLVASAISVFGGSMLASFSRGYTGFQQCWEFGALLRMAPISMLFQLGAVLKFISFRFLLADVVALVSQMNLIFLAVGLCWVLGKRYRMSQWAALLGTFLALIRYLTVRNAANHGDTKQNPLALSSEVSKGLTILFTMCIVDTTAAVLAEKHLKGGKSKSHASFPVKKVHIDFSALILSALWCYVLEPFVLKDMHWSCKPQQCRQVLDAGLFSGWDRWTVAVLVVLILKMWLGCLIATVMDSVVKQLGSCTAMVLTYVEVLWLNPKENPFNPDTALALALVVVGIVLFACSSEDSRRSEQLHEANRKKQLRRAPSFSWDNGAGQDWLRNYCFSSSAAPTTTRHQSMTIGRCESVMPDFSSWPLCRPFPIQDFKSKLSVSRLSSRKSLLHTQHERKP